MRVRRGVVDRREDLDTTIEANGQQRTYLVLSEEERAKDFVRPVRTSYQHVGIPGPRFTLRDLTHEERTRLGNSFAKVEESPPFEDGTTSKRYWTKEELEKINKGCQTITTMGRELAETYARQPTFYCGTFCCGCRLHLPVGPFGEFEWLDGTRVGT